MALLFSGRTAIEAKNLLVSRWGRHIAGIKELSIEGGRLEDEVVVIAASLVCGRYGRFRHRWMLVVYS